MVLPEMDIGRLWTLFTDGKYWIYLSKENRQERANGETDIVPGV